MALVLAAGPTAQPARAQAPIPQGVEFLVNTSTAGSQAYPSAAMDADGDFVIVWHSTGQGGSGQGVYVQRYDAAGVRQGEEVRVNANTSMDQVWPSVAMDAEGSFAVAWASELYINANAFSVLVRRFDAAGVPQGSEFWISDTGSQEHPAVAMGDDGHFVAAWERFNPDEL